MFAPNLSTHQLADSVHHERQAHAARLHRIIRDREAGEAEVDHTAHRRMTARRLVASLTAVALTLVIAAAAAADGPNAAPAGPSKMAPANGGSLVLIR
jgi:hypothetical protein